MNGLALLAIGGGAFLLLSSRKSSGSRQGGRSGGSSDQDFLSVCVESPGGVYKINHPSDPPDNQLVQTQVAGSPTKSRPLRRDAAAAYLAMVAAARADGIPAPYLELLSGYRDASNQAGIRSKAEARTRAEHPDWTAAQVSSAVNKYVAKPGQSAHQSGVAVDLNMGYSYLAANMAKMQATPAFKWMKKNAVRFGFYNYPVEPWHWAYNPPCRGAQKEGDARKYPGYNTAGVRGLGRFVPVIGRWRGTGLGGRVVPDSAHVERVERNRRHRDRVLAPFSDFARVVADRSADPIPPFHKLMKSLHAYAATLVAPGLVPQLVNWWLYWGVWNCGMISHFGLPPSVRAKRYVPKGARAIAGWHVISDQWTGVGRWLGEHSPRHHVEGAAVWTADYTNARFPPASWPPMDDGLPIP